MYSSDVHMPATTSNWQSEDTAVSYLFSQRTHRLDESRIYLPPRCPSSSASDGSQITITLITITYYCLKIVLQVYPLKQWKSLYAQKVLVRGQWGWPDTSTTATLTKLEIALKIFLCEDTICHNLKILLFKFMLHFCLNF